MGRAINRGEDWMVWRFGTVYNKDVVCARLWKLLLHKMTGRPLYIGPEPCKRWTCAKCALPLAENLLADVAEVWKDEKSIWFYETGYEDLRDRERVLARLGARKRSNILSDWMCFWTPEPRGNKVYAFCTTDISGRKDGFVELDRDEGFGVLCQALTVPGIIKNPIGTPKWVKEKDKVVNKGLYVKGGVSTSRKLLVESWEKAKDEVYRENGVKADGTGILLDSDTILTIMQTKIENNLVKLSRVEKARMDKLDNLTGLYL